MFGEWWQAIERRGLNLNLGKTKMMVTGEEMEDVVQVGRYPCAVCCRGVGANSVLWGTCGMWCHRRCTCLRSLSAAAVAHFQCSACARWASCWCEWWCG